jgi:hypothetical protein
MLPNVQLLWTSSEDHKSSGSHSGGVEGSSLVKYYAVSTGEYIHSLPLIVSLSTDRYDVDVLKGLSPHSVPLSALECETRAQACVQS